MKIAFLQFNPIWGHVDENVEQISRFLEESPPVDLVVCPELATTGYSFQNPEEIRSLTKPFPFNREIALITERCRKKTCHIIIGIPEITDTCIYNSAVWIGPGGLCGSYRKIHLFKHEKMLFAPGDAPPPVFDINGVKVGVMICFDWYFPEVARSLMLQGAQIIAHPSNLVLPYCQRVMPSRCLENKVFSITANRIGTEIDREDKPITFTGQSIILNPMGEVLRQASADEACFEMIDIDPTESLNKKITPMNDLLDDRRPELYRLLIQSS